MRKNQPFTATTLGTVDILPQQYAGSDEVYKAEESSGEFVKAGEDTPIVLHEAEHHLDFVSLFV